VRVCACGVWRVCVQCLFAQVGVEKFVGFVQDHHSYALGLHAIGQQGARPTGRGHGDVRRSQARWVQRLRRSAHKRLAPQALHVLPCNQPKESGERTRTRTRTARGEMTDRGRERRRGSGGRSRGWARAGGPGARAGRRRRPRRPPPRTRRSCPYPTGPARSRLYRTPRNRYFKNNNHLQSKNNSTLAQIYFKNINYLLHIILNIISFKNIFIDIKRTKMRRSVPTPQRAMGMARSWMGEGRR